MASAEKILTWLSASGRVGEFASLLNRIRLPYLKWPIRVGQNLMAAGTLDRFIALWFWKLKVLEAFEAKILSACCEPGMTVLDVGANIGFHALRAAKEVGETGTVYAFEPDPFNSATLQHNAMLNHLSNVQVVRKAVGAETGKIQLWVSSYHSGDHRVYCPPRDSRRRPITVDVVTLDDFLDENQPVDIIKMDIQGAEGLALRGMQKLLNRNSNLLLFMEFWPFGMSRTGCSAEAHLNDLVEMGFSIDHFSEKRRQLTPIEDMGAFIEGLTNQSYANILAHRRPLPEKLISEDSL